jgi:hypothetical protein
VYWHQGRAYIAGKPGNEYQVTLRSRQAQDVLAIVSVDGVNVITGETANPDHSGYVLDAYASTEVNGWRKSLSEVAQFNFTNLGNSYAARSGRPDNVGVIGVAVFREKPLFWREGRIAQAPLADRYPPAPAAGMPAARSADAASAKAESAPATAQAMRPARAPQPEESLGTGHGAREHSDVRYTQFVRASTNPDEVDAIWYDSQRNLVARGVIPAPQPIAREPQPFPNGFVPDPAG